MAIKMKSIPGSRPPKAFFTLLLTVLVAGCVGFRPTDERLHQHALLLAHKYILVDTHLDVPYMLRAHQQDLGRSTWRGEFDYARAVEGGLNAPFFAVYIPVSLEQHGAKELADSLIDFVDSIAHRFPNRFALANSPGDVREQFHRGVISICMGMENGAPIQGDLTNVQYFYDRGIRYITLAHAKDNHISDSSYDTTHTWHGLSPFGKQLIGEMNRVGIMVDVSHISDDAFFQVMQLSQAPVIASHSSCRAFTPGFERNMSDEMIRLLASKGGIIMINFGSSFLTEDYQRKEKEVEHYLDEHHLDYDDRAAQEYIDRYRKEHPPGYADVSDVADHIDHVVKLVGVDHVGFGSDFDGVGDSLPTGLKDVSQYPNLILELLKRGYTDEDIHKICGENFLRVWGEIGGVATQLQAASHEMRRSGRG